MSVCIRRLPAFRTPAIAPQPLSPDPLDPASHAAIACRGGRRGSTQALRPLFDGRKVSSRGGCGRVHAGSRVGAITRRIGGARDRDRRKSADRPRRSRGLRIVARAWRLRARRPAPASGDDRAPIAAIIDAVPRLRPDLRGEVIGSFLNAAPHPTGDHSSPTETGWLALEDKTVSMRCGTAPAWNAPRPSSPSRCRPRPSGVARRCMGWHGWSGDPREGFNGGAEFVRW